MGEVLSINSRPMSAADCYDDPEASNVGSPASVQFCTQEECSICTLLAALKAITNGCLACTGNGKHESKFGTCDVCRTQMKDLFKALNAACTGKCDDSIIGEYLCTAATSGMSGQASCSTLDQLSYLVGYLPFGMYDATYGASGYYGYYGSTMSLIAYKTGISLGYGASAFKVGGSDCYYYGSCGRRLSNEAPLGPSFPLGGLSNTGNRRLAEVYKATPWGANPSFITTVSFDETLAGATALLVALEDGVVIDTTASVLSKFLGEIVDSKDSWMKRVEVMVARNVKAILMAWLDLGVPVSVTCDPDFEESAVRDALKLVTTSDGCPGPIAQIDSSQARFLNAAWKGGFASSIWSG